MGDRYNIFGRILTFAIIILAAIVIILQIAYFHAQAQETSLNSQLETLQEQTEDAQATNSSLSEQYDSNLIEWRNAQGRLSNLGNGSGKVCYLTFDDGPSSLTKKNLKILKEKGAVATWFCLGNTKDYEYLDISMCKKIEKQGSVVGIHDWDQNDSYDFYRGSVEDYFKTDFNKTKKVLEKAVGHEINIMRFAGGSLTIGYYNSALKTKLPRAMLKRGYQYFDWNVLAGDSEYSQMVDGSVPTSTIIHNVMKGYDGGYGVEDFAKTDSPVCILMHDNPGKDSTTAALFTLIDKISDLGYTFDTLDYDTPGFYQLRID